MRCLLFLLLLASLLLSSHVQGTRIPIVTDFFSRFADELRFQKSSLEQYRDQISDRLVNSVEKIKAHQEALRNETQEQLDAYVAKFNDLYLESVASLNKEQDTIDEISQQFQKYYKERPKQIDKSLDDFRKFFNESQLPEMPPIWSPSKAKTDKQKLSFGQLDDLWNNINSKLIINKAIKQPKSAEDFMQGVMDDMEKMQEDFKIKMKSIEQKTQTFFQGALNKQEIRNKEQSIDELLQKFDTDGSQWVKEQLHAVDEKFKNLQDMIIDREHIFSALATKKNANLQYTVMLDRALSEVLKLIDQKESAGWKQVREEDDIAVYRKFTGSKYACVKCEAELGVPVDKIFALFEDQTRTKEYNSMFATGTDVEVVAENTKVIWSSSEPVYIMKPRDFCSLMHVRKLKDGTLVVLQKAIDHPAVPIRAGLVRGEIILGANIVQPVKGNPKRCRVTMITQVNPGGFSPPVIINKIASMGPVGYLKALEKAAACAPSPAVKEEKRKLVKLGATDPKFKPFKV